MTCAYIPIVATLFDNSVRTTPIQESFTISPPQTITISPPQNIPDYPDYLPEDDDEFDTNGKVR